jgi:hypothetical protein
MAAAVKDSVISNLAKLTGLIFDDIVEKVEKAEKMVEEGN